MVRPINKDVKILSKVSVTATKNDLNIAQDLIDTLNANSNICAGMAANMIGENKRIIAITFAGITILMINPVILNQSDSYTATEGCLSLPGERTTTRYKKIRVRYQDKNFQTYEQDFQGYPAHIIQHEIDHLQGILI